MDERKMLSRVVEKHVDDGIGYIDPIVDSWRERLIVFARLKFFGVVSTKQTLMVDVLKLLMMFQLYLNLKSLGHRFSRSRKLWREDLTSSRTSLL